ncbi:MAG: 30S ribosomal protein S2 [Fidelibacterota bacterium]|nr:MAG: 30S ribosomal protein S2 [Candidatus Neomarinimicrobiota bacterium]
MASASQVTTENLISTGAHFGHLTRRWHPNYKPFIYMEKNGIHIIDIQQTMNCLNRAIEAVSKIVREGGSVLFVGTKKQAKDVLQREADRSGMYYVVERWLGGTLTNFSTIKRSIKRLQQLEKDADTLYQTLTKKEILRLERERIRLSDQHRGIKDMKQLPDAIYVVDAQFEATVIREARRLEIPIIAIVDSNSDPTLVDYPIPANDDSLRTIQLITSAITDAIIEARGGQSFEEAEESESDASAAETAAPAEADQEDVPAESGDLPAETDAQTETKPAESEPVTPEEEAEEIKAEVDTKQKVDEK